MAFNASINDRRVDDLRFRGVDDDPVAPLRQPGDIFSSGMIPNSESRGHLFRRFTTESLTPLSIKSVWETPRTDGLELNSISEADQRVRTIIQQKQMQVELRRQQMYAYQAQQKLLEDQNRLEEEEMLRMAQSLDRIALNGASKFVGQSEPTTPPEYREGLFARTKGLGGGSQSLATPPNSKRTEQQQLITPPAEDMFTPFDSRHSGTNSRRNSGEQEAGTPLQHSFGSGTSLRRSIPHTSSDQSLGSTVPRFGLNTDILFDEDLAESSAAAKREAAKSPQEKKYLQMMNTNGNFPILTGGPDNKLSASSAALDLARHPSEKSSGPASVPWDPFSSVFNRTHRPAQHSLPVNSFPLPPVHSSSSGQLPNEDSILARNEQSGILQNRFSETLSTRPLRPENTPGHTRHLSMPRLQPSYSTNDIPTMRNAGYSAAPGRSAVGPLVHQPHMGHSLGDRMRHARDTPISERSMMPPMTNTFSAHGGPNLQLIPFPVSGSFMGPSITSPAAGPFGGYGNFNSLNHSVFSSRSSARNHGELTLPSHPHPQSLPHSGSGRSSYKMRHDPRHDPRQENRQENRQDPRQDPRNDPEARFANATMESLVGQIYGLCKDQHGCRFLQKKLEEGNPTYVEMIFKETHPYVVELMTDPFGNYLCQKLLDFANDEQRTVLVQTAAPRLVTIALNQHGTRALQKMIESLRTPEQINIVINALKNRVVELIKDLNGNHVIQKCLNRLKSEDAQFIFDAVGEHCIEVGTHRHGCCVLQRCIDHADGEQKGRLIQQITLNSLALVQDAFGNYVVQYILDLGEAKYSEPVVLQFRGRVCDLAKQKFSSNVIEKCIRVAEPATKKILIEELADPNEIQDVLKDCYANYVVQTAMDYSDLQSSLLLYRRLESLTQAIRGFPYGKRIQSKLQSLEARINAAAPGTLTRTRTYSLGAPSSATQSPPRTSGNVQQNQLLDGQTNNQQKGHLSNLLNGQEDKPQQVPSTAAPPPAPFPSQDGPGNYNVHM